LKSNIRKLTLIFCILLSGCTAALPLDSTGGQLISGSAGTATPFQPATPSLASQPLRMRVDNDVPSGLLDQLRVGDDLIMVDANQPADILFSAQNPDRVLSKWVYALVAPFPTVTDGISTQELKSIWQGEPFPAMQEQSLLMEESTLRALADYWGQEPGSLVKALPANEILDAAWQAKTAWAIVPFEALEPRWKVLRLDGLSPYDMDFQLDQYPLTILFGISAMNPITLDGLKVDVLPSNRDQSKMTSLLMTGVTALTRATGKKMETEGMLYPARDTIDWFRSADLVHVSNEVSFTNTCPPANPFQTALQFCSRPEYIELLDYIGVDIMELSGNHLMDWGWEPFNESMKMYEERGWKVYSAGENQEAAKQPLLMEHNGNKLAFIACNPAGPERVWATDEFPGVATCDYDWITVEIKRLSEQGYLVIATQQFFESYGFVPGAQQVQVFNQLADAGAVIVSGSQAHHPQGMAFTQSGSFIHYGLGNLFFDQMRMPDGAAPEVFSPDLPIAGVRLEFLDRHIFYNGKYLGTDLLTAVLEDYARPRPMTADERAVFLREAFSRSGWK